jgi:hypothetical protein
VPQHKNALRGFAGLALLAVAAFGSQRAEAICTFGAPFGGEPSLQAALNGLLAPAPNTTTDCLADGTDAHWTSVSPTSATILLEIAGFANQNRFGIYDAANPDNRVQIFNGASGPGTTALLSFTSVAGGTQVTITVGTRSWSSTTPFVGDAFGFYLRTPDPDAQTLGQTFFSDSSLNGGLDRMYAYRGNGGQFISGPVANDGNPANDIFGATDALLAYEDLVHGDRDFQDFVVLVRGVTPVPLPTAAWLLASGLLTLGAAARRRRDVAHA